jgi:hypothetical protein
MAKASRVKASLKVRPFVDAFVKMVKWFGGYQSNMGSGRRGCRTMVPGAWRNSGRCGPR